jgi:hypothetical protein
VIVQGRAVEKSDGRWAVVYSDLHRERIESVVQALEGQGFEPRVFERGPFLRVAVVVAETAEALGFLRRWERRGRRLGRIEGRQFARDALTVFFSLAFGALFWPAAPGLAVWLALPLILAVSFMMRRLEPAARPRQVRAPPPGTQSGVLGSAGPAGRDDLVLVYTALYGPNAHTALHILHEAGCEPVPLDEPFAVPALPYVAPTYEIRIAVPSDQVAAAGAALRAWAGENEAREARFRREMRGWLLKTAGVLLVAFVIAGLWLAAMVAAGAHGFSMVVLGVAAVVLGLLVTAGWIRRAGPADRRRRRCFVVLAAFLCLGFAVFVLHGDAALRPAPLDEQERRRDSAAPED